LFLIRNIIVHNRGIINKEFLEKYRGDKNDLLEDSEILLTYPQITEWAYSGSDRIDQIALIEQIGEKIISAILKK
jgi:hypothetical protein